MHIVYALDQTGKELDMALFEEDRIVGNDSISWTPGIAELWAEFENNLKDNWKASKRRIGSEKRSFYLQKLSLMAENAQQAENAQVVENARMAQSTSKGKVWLNYRDSTSRHLQQDSHPVYPHQVLEIFRGGRDFARIQRQLDVVASLTADKVMKALQISGFKGNEAAIQELLAQCKDPSFEFSKSKLWPLNPPQASESIKSLSTWKLLKGNVSYRDALLKNKQPSSLSTQSMRTEEVNFCRNVLRELKEQQYYNISRQFLEPPVLVRAELEQYLRRIEVPMFLSTISENMKKGAYNNNPADFYRDVKLMFSNCYLSKHRKAKPTTMASSLRKSLTRSGLRKTNGSRNQDARTPLLRESVVLMTLLLQSLTNAASWDNIDLMTLHL